MAKAKKKASEKAEKEPVVDATGKVIGGGESTEKVSKADAVRACLAEGVTKPQDASEWIKAKYGIDIAPQVFSSYKSSLGKKAEGGSSAHGKQSGGVDMATLEEVKKLVDKVGAAQVKQLAGFFE